MTSADVLVEILTTTAPLPGLERIGYRYTQPRDPKRDRDAIKRALALAYVEWRRQLHADQSSIVSVRRQKGQHTVIQVTRWRSA